jgi:PhnB protein
MQVQVYLFLEGRCEEAAQFYETTLGAERLALLRFRDMPDPPPGAVPPGSEDKVLHAALRIGETTVMMSDGECGGRPGFQGFSLALQVKDEAEADRLFAALAEGGEIRMPLGQTFFSPRFGVVTDRFGVSWMVNVDAQQTA